MISFSQADEIDTAAIVLRKDMGWNVGTHKILTSQGSVEITYEIAVISDSTLTIENNTSLHLCGVFISPVGDDEDNTNANEGSYVANSSEHIAADEEIPPGASFTFELSGIGSYRIVADDCHGLLGAELQQRPNLG